MGTSGRPGRGCCRGGVGTVIWYLDHAVRVQLNYERTNLNRNILFGPDVRNHEDVFLSQWQVAF